MNGVIYIDVLYLINFALDAAAFWATSRFMSIKPRLLRLLAASLIGATASVLAVSLDLNNIFLAACAIGIILLSLYILIPGKTIGFILKSLAVYLLIVFAMAGAALGGKTILADNSLQNSWKILIFALAAAAIMACYGMGMVMQKWQRRSFCRKIKIMLCGKEIVIEGFIDTGNDLCEPISRNPAIIAELSSLSGLFPQNIFSLLQQNAFDNPMRVIEGCSNELWKMRFRLLPYSSIGGSGILLGFKPDIVIVEGEENIYTDEVIICFYGSRLAVDCGARAIINPAVMTLPNIFMKKKVC